jgi:hypothetical protein
VESYYTYVAGLVDDNLQKREMPFMLAFEEYNTESCMKAPVVSEGYVISLSVADVSKTFKQVNTHKVAG